LFNKSMKGVEARSDIPDTLPAPLIVNAGGVIQYLADCRMPIAKLAQLAPDYFIVSQLPMSDLPTYARVQLNVPNRKIAQWVFNRAEFTSEVSDLGYELAFAVDHDLRFTHKNAPGPSVIGSMIFRRSTDHR
jgi:putative methyltransferase (TIGR04325 family)